MALTFTKVMSEPVNLGGLSAMMVEQDITEYAAGGLTPSARPEGTVDGIIVLWQENADYVFRWDRTNLKLLAYVMSTGVEAGAVDVGQVKLLLVSRFGA